jgi:hypothetical protein
MIGITWLYVLTLYFLDVLGHGRHIPSASTQRITRSWCLDG